MSGDHDYTPGGGELPEEIAAMFRRVNEGIKRVHGLGEPPVGFSEAVALDTLCREMVRLTRIVAAADRLADLAESDTSDYRKARDAGR